MSQYDTKKDLKINVWPIFHSPVILPSILDFSTLYFQIISQYDTMFDFKINVDDSDIFHGRLIFALYIEE